MLWTVWMYLMSQSCPLKYDEDCQSYVISILPHTHTNLTKLQDSASGLGFSDRGVESHTAPSHRPPKRGPETWETGRRSTPQQAVGPVMRGGAPRVGPLAAEGKTKAPNPCRKEHRAGLLQSWGPPADTGEPDCWPLWSSISCLLDSGRTRAMRLLERKQEIGNSPGGPVVRTLHLYCRGPRFNSRLGNQDPTCSVERPHTHTHTKRKKYGK